MKKKTNTELREELGGGILPQGKSGLSSIDSFYERKYYKDEVYPDSEQIPSQDFWYEKPFYGLIDRKANLVYVSESYLKQLKAKQTLLALNFVTDAFEDLKRYLAEKISSGDINPTKTVFGKIEPYSAWESVHNGYHILAQLHYDQFYSDWSTRKCRNLKINSFQAFMGLFMEYLLKVSSEFPFTRSQFLTSRYCSPMISGLVINIKNADSNDDYIKTVQFLNDPNFEFFRKAAKKHGFMLDENAPWRLVADIGSSAMKAYMAPYGLTFDNLFDVAYYQAKLSDFDNFKEYMKRFYESYSNSLPEVVYPMRAESGAVDMAKKTRKVTSSAFISSLSDSFWFEYYIQLRLKELNMSLTKSRYNIILNNTIAISKVRGTEEALIHLDKTLGGFDPIAFPEKRKMRFR
jgi:hypothetical protein